jgi:hypothetical protein
MKYHSEFNKEYVNDICTEMQRKGVLADKVENLRFEPQSFPTFTKMLQENIVMSQSIFTYLDDLGLVNRGRCPYTGQKIDNSFPSWSYMNNRRVYVSHEGYKIMQKEDDEEYERIMGVPAPARKPSGSNKSSGCYIATACYGNEFAPQVIALKVYRDQTLSKSILGRLFIKSYYFLSPPIANRLKNQTKLNNFVREKILNKIVNKIK